MSARLKLAVPNKGRLSERALELLSNAGYHVPRHARRLMADVNDHWRLLFVRTDDIPEYVATGTADVGITGWDLVSEHGHPVEKFLELGFGKCRLVVAAPQSSQVTDVKQLQGKRIATVFPNLTQKFFSEKGINIDIIPLSGATEIAPNIGVAEAIIDLVETGSTLRQNGLVELETFLYSEAVVIANQDSLQKNPDALLELKTLLNGKHPGIRN
jgi:ATP phosphoribosyltransferase